MIHTVLFDFDGTLFDSMSIWSDTATKLIESYGIDPDKVINEKTRQMSIKQASEYLEEKYKLGLSPDQVKDKIVHIVRDFYLNKAIPKEGVSDLLEVLKSRDTKMAIVSANEKEIIDTCLNNHKLNQYFVEIFTCSGLGLNKDNPDFYKNVVKLLNAENCTNYIFDDSHYAIMAAKKAGLKTIGVYDKYEPQTNEIADISDYYLKDFREFKDFFLDVIDKEINCE